MIRELKIFPTMVRIGFADLFAWRAQVLIWILTTTMPLIMYEVWSTLAENGRVGRFDNRTFAAYFLSTLVVRQFASSWVVWELNEHIRTGQLAPMLLRPVHPLWFYASENIGALPFRIAVLTPLIGVAFVVLPDMAISPTPLHLALYVWTIALTWILTFFIQSMIGLAALYTQQSLSFQDAWFGLWAILSGYLIPLELLPGLAKVAVWLPFRSMGSLPTEIILGHLEGEALVQGVATQIVWVIICLFVVRFVWSRGIRRFEAYGG
jgi:ABC-2 type transport system permease protein